MLPKRRRLKFLSLFRNKRLGSERVTLHGEDSSGNLLTVLVDSNGNLISIMQGDDSGTLRTIKVDSNARMEAVLKGLEGANFRTIAVDTAGRIINVIRDPSSDNYMAVDANGYMGAILKAAADVNIQGNVPVDQNAKDREMQGVDGVTLRTVAVDASGQMIMVPRGSTGNYMVVDANGYMTSVMKGLEGVNLRSIALDSVGQIITILKGASGNNVTVDASGYLTAAVRGDQGVVAQDASNKLISVMQGSQGINVAQQATTGELISAMKGDDSGTLRTIKVDANARMETVMKGLEGANFRTITVDSAGNIVGVFKGDFEGALKTLKVDTDGYLQTRLLGMHASTLKTVAVDTLGRLKTDDRYSTVDIDHVRDTNASSSATYWSPAVPAGKIWRVSAMTAEASKANAVLAEVGIYKADIFDYVHLVTGGAGRKISWEGSPKPMSAGWKVFVNFDSGDSGGTLDFSWLYEEESV